MIICLRTVAVPDEERDRYLAWIAEGRAVREQHGILAELVLEPSDGNGETVVMPSSRVYLHEAQWLDHDLPRQSHLRIVVRGGYYVRALARDLGITGRVTFTGLAAHDGALHAAGGQPVAALGPRPQPLSAPRLVDLVRLRRAGRRADEPAVGHALVARDRQGDHGGSLSARA